ncbi:substrate-binding periplasmic protein [Pseudoalteromonas luteoviolacea]|nr:transporter substrate-binding domain-containing protein [Pseudoalteromonas luteoviolacea]MBQ4880100.1 transporter substrate-binding domain-containing protein [Pseudoalteromonas luteoviolacea]MBQ4909117.1 transporter substrate-binding domain-containing protein [Pseudoalteromonas luteoviolacea]
MMSWRAMAGHFFKVKCQCGNLSVYLAASLLLLLSQQAYAARVLQFVTLEYPPYQYLEGNQPKGVGIAMVNEIFERMDKPIAVRFMPWGRAIREIQSGHADGIFTIYSSKARKQTMLFSEQVLINQSVSIFSKRDSKLNLTGTIDELSELSVGLVRNVSYGFEIDQAIKQGQIHKIVEANSGMQSFKLLFAGRVDIVISNQLGGADILRRLDIQNEIKRHTEYAYAIPSYFAFPKTRRGEKLKKRFDETLLQMKADGTYQAVLQQALDCTGSDC